MTASLRAHARRHLAIATLALAWFAAGAAGQAAGPGIEAERMSIGDGAGKSVKERGRSGGHVLLLTTRLPVRGRIATPEPRQLRAVVRAAGCGGSPNVVISLNGRRVIKATLKRSRWVTLAAPTMTQAGTYTVSVRLANATTGKCRRGLRIDRIYLARMTGGRVAVPPTGGGGGATPAGSWWRPPARTTWQWQLSGGLDTSVAAQLYDVDMAGTSAQQVAALHAQGRRVVCYMSAGSVENGRSDAGAFPAAVQGNALAGWPNERWLDIRRLDVLLPIMGRRLDQCKAKGFDAVEFDNVDAYSNNTGFPLNASHQLAYNRALADAAHARGLGAALKNDLAQAAALEPSFDFAIVEQCFQYNECQLAAPFLRAGKAVLVAEYDLSTGSFCAQANAMGIMAMRKELSLGASREVCW